MLVGENSRLIMSKMVLENFKSYAGRIEIGPFHKSFSSIVGPNGSGKSNVIDALLFVFGFKAKKLRQGKLADLIHNSSNFPDLRSCSVEIHFCKIRDIDHPGVNEDGYEVLPGTEFVVSRTVRKTERSESSTYYVNGRPQTYQEIQTLLKSYGVDLDHKRFLILQGEVESISLMKPKGSNENEDGLLEYLEDIIGTNALQEPIELASAELDKVNEEYEQELSRFKHVQKESNNLKEKSEEALKFIEYENRITVLKSKMLQVKRFQAQTALDKLKTEFVFMLN